MGRPRTWTDEQLRDAVASARCMADVLRSLGIRQQRTVRARAAALGLVIPVGTRRGWGDDELREAVRTSSTVREALSKLGLQGRGANYATFHAHAARLGIDTAHFAGRGHLAKQARINLKSRRPLNQILVEGGAYPNTKRLGERLLREGYLQARCSGCGLEEWQGRPIPLELDHVNGDRADLRRANLRFLCPNCHALTPTYRGKNATRERREQRLAR